MYLKSSFLGSDLSRYLRCSGQSVIDGVLEKVSKELRFSSRLEVSLLLMVFRTGDKDMEYKNLCFTHTHTQSHCTCTHQSPIFYFVIVAYIRFKQQVVQ